MSAGAMMPCRLPQSTIAMSPMPRLRPFFHCASNAGNQRGSQHRTDARNIIEPLTLLIGSVPGRNQTIEL
jgi:hypothetical protein